MRHAPFQTGFAVALLTLAAAAAPVSADTSFATRLVIPPGQWIHNGSIEDAVLSPDTTLRALAANGITTIASNNNVTDYDPVLWDDFWLVGDGRGSGIFFVPVNPDGTIYLDVSGSPDMTFREPAAHNQSGPFDLWLLVYDPLDDLVLQEFYQDVLSPGRVIQFNFETQWDATYSFDAFIDNLIGGGGPRGIQYVAFTGLTPGLPFTAHVASSDFDALLGWFSPDDELIEADEISGPGETPLLAGIVPANGEVVLAVTSWRDIDFRGFSGETGQYQLVLAVVPEPSGAMLCLLAAAGGLAFVRGRRTAAR